MLQARKGIQHLRNKKVEKNDGADNHHKGLENRAKWSSGLILSLEDFQAEITNHWSKNVRNSVSKGRKLFNFWEKLLSNWSECKNDNQEDERIGGQFCEHLDRQSDKGPKSVSHFKHDNETDPN